MQKSLRRVGALAVQLVLFSAFGQRPAKFLVLALVALQTASGPATAQDFKALFREKLPAETTPVEATWLQSSIFIPESALKIAGNGHLNVAPKKANWAAGVKAMLNDGARLPAVIFLHGCDGFGAGRGFAPYFLAQGFAFFAPDSFARPGRQAVCGKGQWFVRNHMRQEELNYALPKIRKIDWIDPSRLILAGFSEGGAAVADLSSKEFIAQVIFGYDCKATNGSPNAPMNVPVLNLVGDQDEYGTTPCFISADRPAGSKSIQVKGVGHTLDGSEIPRMAVTEFLQTCCVQK